MKPIAFKDEMDTLTGVLYGFSKIKHTEPAKKQPEGTPKPEPKKK